MAADSTSDSMSSLGDAELLDVVCDEAVRHRRSYSRQLQAIAEIDARGICNEHGHYVGTAALIREMLNLDPHEARRMVAHAEVLNETVSPSGARIEAKLPVVAEALAEGAISPEHVEVIRKAITTLPDTASLEDRAVAEKILCEAAVSCEPRIVRRLGQEIHHRLNPDGDKPKDTTLRDPLRRLNIRERKDGGVSGTFDLDAESGALLTNLLSPLTAPTPGPNGWDERSPSERRGDAFAHILKAAANCPDASTEAGEPVTVMVNVSLEDLKTGVGRGLIDGHTNISAAQIRRMACDAKILPVVLGSKSEPLDIGRATRVVPRSIRRALIQRDRGCTFPSCTKRAKWTHAHHVRHWASGGPTSLQNLALLCHHHHRLIHHSDWEIRMIQGHPWFIPPSHVDHQRTPRRNVLHSTRAP
ncbi:HNH endonuclease [Amycolatopsis taiwanensis]|uniref:HNH endonuclease n=2 Tax=Amycolatopsis taiwanensis TaxID=342230 RepID=A0A9W6R7Q6_9PSEU|nr:HNH endonuclease [Amycolatopsis taiwanensis]